MEFKTFPVAHLKALRSETRGEFEAIVSVFGNTDRYGDRVYNGAFVDDLQKGFAPIVWSHAWGTVPIGVTLEMHELERAELVRLIGTDDLAPEITGGLYGKGALLVDDHEIARQCYAAMRAVGGDGRAALREFSFAYDVLDAAWVTEDGDEHYALRKLAMNEWGPCLKGVNDSTQLVGVKGDALGERVRPPRPSESSEKANPQANPPTGGEEPAAGADLRKAYLDVRYAVPRH